MNATWKVKWDSFSCVLLLIFVAAHMLLLFLGIKYLLPDIWRAQFAAGWLAIGLVFLGRSVSNCFLEWFAHRYMLHRWIISWLKRFCRNHRKHHGLTPIGRGKASSGEVRIFSRYFLDEHGDWFNVSFADYTLLAFLATETFFILPLQILFPQMPFLLGGYLAVACSYALYELIHPLEHRPTEWWEAQSRNPFWVILRPYTTRLRRRHQFHHLHPMSCMAIMGLFGYPLADKVMGTDKLPKNDLNDGLIVNQNDLIPPQPRKLVMWIDNWAWKREKRFCLEKGY